MIEEMEEKAKVVGKWKICPPTSSHNKSQLSIPLLARRELYENTKLDRAKAIEMKFSIYFEKRTTSSLQ